MKLSKLARIALLAVLSCMLILVACDTNNDISTEAPTSESTEAPTGAPTEAPAQDENKYPTISIKEAIEICMKNDEPTVERYYLKGTITAIDNAQYGAMTISDGTGSIYVYGTYSSDGSIGYAEMEEKPYKGDEVVLHCTLQNYNGTPEVKNARLIEFKRADIEIDESAYAEMTIAEARDAESGEKVKVTGVVAAITYADGYIPMGTFLVDGTQSIYVYGRDLAQRVNVGNTVTILSTKEYWVLENEKNNADKFGYSGCCQLAEAELVSIDESVKEFDKTWIPESCVKDIIETPVTENITTTIYKVNALVKKVEGTGFTNYYFFDIDGETGTYTYSQCSGGDFSWLDKFDGKICTVYISALNAKSTATECFFRFVPVAVYDDGFKFDTSKTAEYALKYHGIDQFRESYTGNPAAELVTSVSSELLGFEGATLTYFSSNESVVYFTTEGSKVIFNCGESGKATVTVKAVYNGKEATAKVEITVGENASVDAITVKEAVDSADDTEVVVKGIVGPSVVNKDGFYLIDETGVIAVLVNDVSVFDEIEIGHEVVIRGKRECYKKDTTSQAGQISIVSAEVVANYYGDHEYDTGTFITGKTLADLYALDAMEDHSAEVYIVKATVNLVENAYYTSIELKDGGTTLGLYCSGAGQYSFLKDFAGQEVEMEIAPCNWNDKKYYRGCVLAVYTEDGKVLNELNFNN